MNNSKRYQTSANFKFTLILVNSRQTIVHGQAYYSFSIVLRMPEMSV